MLARFSTFFAMLYRSGISVLDCIQICEKIMGNRVMEEALQRVGRSISEGQGISQAFAATKLFPRWSCGCCGWANRRGGWTRPCST